MTDHLSIEQRLRKLEAVAEIEALKYRYLRACDNKDLEGFREAFIQSGAVIDYGPMGKFSDADGIADVFEKVALQVDGDQHVVLDMHHAVHPEITVTGDDTAEGIWSLRFRQLNLAQSTEIISAIEYRDEYVVENDSWKISYCESTTLWSLARPIGEGFAVTDNLPIDN